MEHKITEVILAHYPDAQGVYLFGTYGSEYQRPDSDVDLAILLPPKKAKQLGPLAQTNCHLALGELLSRRVDIINVRTVNTVFKNEIVNTGRILLVADKYALEEFEMLTWSLYQKLNEERAAILEQLIQTKRVYEP